MRLNLRSRHLSKAQRKRKERILATRSEQDVHGNRRKGLTKAAARLIIAAGRAWARDRPDASLCHGQHSRELGLNGRDPTDRPGR